MKRSELISAIRGMFFLFSLFYKCHFDLAVAISSDLCLGSWVQLNLYRNILAVFQSHLFLFFEEQTGNFFCVLVPKIN